MQPHPRIWESSWRGRAFIRALLSTFTSREVNSCEMFCYILQVRLRVDNNKYVALLLLLVQILMHANDMMSRYCRKLSLKSFFRHRLSTLCVWIEKNDTIALNVTCGTSSGKGRWFFGRLQKLRYSSTSFTAYDASWREITVHPRWTKKDENEEAGPWKRKRLDIPRITHILYCIQCKNIAFHASLLEYIFLYKNRWHMLW